jgi:putative aminopeptidase FrvX
MNGELQKLFQRLIEAPGAPGFEHEVRAVMKEELHKVSDEIIQDNLGSIFGIKRGNPQGPRIMVAGHMDEVGFMVTQITEKGFIRFQTLGGWWSQVLLAQRVHIITENGPVEGVIGSHPPHVLKPEQRKRPMDIKRMFIDIGADDREDAENIGIKQGQPIVPVCPYTPLSNPKKVMAKAWDNRYGCGLAVELLKELQGEHHPNIVYSGANVQEEVGLRGAQTAANMIEPHIFFALDAGPANDTPGVSEGFGKIGKGALLRIYDRSMITHRELRDFILDIAEAENIPYQFFVSQGGTDAGRVHTTGSGVPSAVIGICARYIHSHASIAHLDDIEAAKQLLVTLVKKLDKTTVESICNQVL